MTDTRQATTARQKAVDAISDALHVARYGPPADAIADSELCFFAEVAVSAFPTDSLRKLHDERMMVRS